MIKKTSLYLTTLTFLVGFFPISQAKAITPDYSQDFWSLEEIMAVREDAKQEVIATCQDSPEFDCAERYHIENFFSRGSEYQAADNMNAFRYLITAVNPATNSVRVIYFDDDMLNYYMTGELIEENINELYMFWFDLGHLGYDFYEQYHAGTLPDKTHLLFARENLATSFPPNEEVTFELEGDVKANYRNMIYYFFVTESGIRYMDPIDYNNCINHPSYKDGMECRLFYEKSEGGNPVYLPVETRDESALEEPVDNPNEEESDPAPSGQGTATDVTEGMTSTPLAPNTGTSGESNNTSTSCERRIEFPWWMIILIALGEIITIWCLLPNYPKYHKK